MKNRRNICIYGASSNNIDDIFKQAAYETGQIIADRGYGLICGGGRGGLMAASIDGTLSRGGRAIGVLPEFMIERDWQHTDLSEIIITPDMHTRKQTMARLSSGVIALPGGVGTLEELMEIITWRQLKLYSGKVVILNTDGFYNPLLKMLDDIVSKGFMRKSESELWQTAQTPEEAVEKVL